MATADRGTQSLIADALLAAARPTDTEQPDEATDLDGRDPSLLLDLFFELDDPLEHEALLERICAIDAPVVTEFLRTVLANDEDEVLSWLAAAELARRGDPGGLAALAETLASGDLEEYAAALHTLVEIHGPPYYEQLQQWFCAGELDGDQLKEVMAAMEALAPQRALQDFTDAIDAVHDIAGLPEERVEAAMLAFARHAHRAGREALERLLERVRNAPIEEADRDELAEFVGRGLLLF